MHPCETCGLPVVRLIVSGESVLIDPYVRTFAPLVPPDRLEQAAQDGDTGWQSGARVEHRFVCKGPVRTGERKPKAHGQEKGAGARGHGTEEA